jgi:hypothetical protein
VDAATVGDEVPESLIDEPKRYSYRDFIDAVQLELVTSTIGQIHPGKMADGH